MPDYILRNEPSCVSVFIHNTAENRINRIMEYDKVTEQEAKDRMASIDKSRSSYYNYALHHPWLSQSGPSKQLACQPDDQQHDQDDPQHAEQSVHGELLRPHQCPKGRYPCSVPAYT